MLFNECSYSIYMEDDAACINIYMEIRYISLRIDFNYRAMTRLLVPCPLQPIPDLLNAFAGRPTKARAIY